MRLIPFGICKERIIDIKISSSKKSATVSARVSSVTNAEQKRQIQIEEIKAENKKFVERLKEAFLYAHAAYSTEQHIVDYYKGTSHVAFYDSYLGVQAFTLIQNRTAILSFRGTTDITDIVVDVMILPFYCPPSHLGFGWSWRSVRKSMRQWLEDNQAGFDRIALYGHSLGGAIAHVAAMELCETYEVAEVITYGAPRSFPIGVGGRYDKTPIYGDSTQTLADRTFRVVNKLDIVTTIPYPWMFYVHVGQVVYVNKVDQIVRSSSASEARRRDGIFTASLKYLWPDEPSFRQPHSQPSDPNNDITDWQGNYYGYLVNAESPTFEWWQKVRSKINFLSQFFPLNLVFQGIAIALVPVVSLGMLLNYFWQAGGAHGRSSYSHQFLNHWAKSALPTATTSTFSRIVMFVCAVVLVPIIVAALVYALYEATAVMVKPLVSLFQQLG